MSCAMMAIDASSTNSAQAQTITLVTKCEEGRVEIEVSVEAAKKSTTLKENLANIAGPNEILVPNISATTLSLVVQFLEHLVTDPSQTTEDSLDLTAWEREFFNNVSDEQLFDLTTAGDYLDCKRLLNVAATRIAEECKDKDAEQIRARFNIENTLTPEQEEKIKKEMDWVDEKVAIDEKVAE